ncbi:transposase [Pseudomonas tolaasii]|uniref:transposase n=1 Tax=Pseudomonas tolaasii TaxID=29442 RepID=UPI001C59510C|nr:transposase [Pseudomonas tolaasii]MBW1245501.1 transposase [Pseudomonas tolaasii]
MRQRKSYPKSFKSQVVKECQQPGVSVAAIAMSYGINVNVVRRWLPLFSDLLLRVPLFEDGPEFSGYKHRLR